MSFCCESQYSLYFYITVLQQLPLSRYKNFGLRERGLHLTMYTADTTEIFAQFTKAKKSPSALEMFLSLCQFGIDFQATSLLP